MINHQEILDYCNYLITKDQVADPISPLEYNAIIPIVNIEVYNREKKRLTELSMGQHYKFIELLRESYLQDLKKTYGLNFSTVSMPLPDDCDMVLTCIGKYNNKVSKVTIVNEDKATDMSMGLVDGEDAPYAYVVGKTLWFSVSLEPSIIYLAIPPKPVYDYFVDAVTLNSHYFKPNCYIAKVGAIWNVYDNTGSVIYSNVQPPRAGNPAVVSISAEFSWKDSLVTTIVNLIFEKMGINMREQVPIEMAQYKKQEVE